MRGQAYPVSQRLCSQPGQKDKPMTKLLAIADFQPLRLLPSRLSRGRGIMQELSGAEKFRTIGDLEPTQVPDGFVIYDEAKEKVHYLNPVASVIYLLCDGNRSVSNIQLVLREAYDLEEDVALDSFFAELVQAGLVCQQQ